MVRNKLTKIWQTYHRYDDVSVTFWSIKILWFLYAGQFKWRNICCILVNLKTMSLLRYGQLKGDVSVTFLANLKTTILFHFRQFQDDVSVTIWPI